MAVGFRETSAVGRAFTVTDVLVVALQEFISVYSNEMVCNPVVCDVGAKLPSAFRLVSVALV